MLNNKKIVMCGCHEVGINIITHLLENGIKFSYFVILTEEQAQKYKISGYSDFSSVAKKYNIPIYTPNSYNLKEKEDIAFFEKNNFDLLIQGGWQRLFPKEVLNSLSIGAIGGHGSSDFLPKGRGRSPLNWSLIENKKRFIMQLFIIKEGIDDGEVFDYEQFDINEFDDINTLYYKNYIVSCKMLLRSIPKILENQNYYKKEQIGEPTYYIKRTEEDGLIDFDSMDIDYINNLVRATTKPYPGAFCYYKNEKIKIWKSQIFDRSIKYENSKYGEIVEIIDNNLIINCLGGLLLISIYETNSKIEKNFLFKKEI